MTYEEYERGEEMKAQGEVAQANLKAILDDHGCETVGQLARNAYKYTDCGAWLSVEVWGYERSTIVHGDAVRDLPTDAPIIAIHVGSIVEGVDGGVDAHIVDLLDEAFEEPAMAAAAYNRALEEVEKEAEDIWNETHGCTTCAQHWRDEGWLGGGSGGDGVTRVWDECPACSGSGSII